MDELKTILQELSNEFIARQREFTESNKIGYGIKLGKYAGEGTKRRKGGTEQVGISFDFQMFYQQLTYLLNTFSSGEKLHNYISNNNLWHDDIEQFNGTTMSLPNMIGRVGGGFLCRNFELNNNAFIITQTSFDQAYKELIHYFSKDFILCEHYVHLKGIGGNVDDVILNDTVSIVRAGFERAKFFSINYNLQNYHDVEVYEDDYLLKILFKIPKEHYKKGFNKAYIIKRDEITKWKNFVQLAIPNLLILGKEIQLSKDWVTEYNFAMGPYGNERRLWDEPKVVLTSDIITNFKSIAKTFETIKDFKNLDKKILYSLERLTKSKSAWDINDRVIDLAISFEYLINTSNMDVTLQLCLKVIKLLYDENDDHEEVYKNLKAFYNLRSKVIHGNDKLVNDEKNVIIIESAEKIIRQAILKFIGLNQNYTYDQIDKQLVRSLYLAKPLTELLG